MGVSCFNGRGGCFTDGSGAPFLSGGGCPMRGYGFWWGGFEKNHKMGGGGATPSTMGNPDTGSEFCYLKIRFLSGNF